MPLKWGCPFSCLDSPVLVCDQDQSQVGDRVSVSRVHSHQASLMQL